MYFPISEIEVAWYIPILVSAGISFFTSMAGLSGAFLLLPFQIEVLHYHSPSVSATNQFYNIIATPTAIYRYIREKRLHFPLTKILLIGSIPGIIAGVLVRSYLLTDPEYFKKYAACILLYLMYRMIKDYFGKSLSHMKPINPYSLSITKDNEGICVFSFDGVEYTYAKKQIISLAAFISFLGGIYGIGGGAILTPLLLSFYRLPVYITAASTLIATTASSIIGVTIFYILSLVHPERQLEADYLLGLFFGFGGMIGMGLGSIMQKYFPARLITLFVIILLFITSALWLEPVFFGN